MPQINNTTEVYCSECGHRQESSMIFNTVEGKVLCPVCLPLRSFICNDCGERFLKENRCNLANGAYICEECRDENHLCCAHCEEWFSEENGEIRYYDNLGEHYCNDCFDNHYAICECGQSGSQEDFIHYDGRWWCRNCEDRYLTRCVRCENFEYQDEAVYNESTDETFCRRCYERGLAQRNILIQDYSYQPEPDFSHHKSENGEKKRKLYMGFELEVEVESRSTQLDEIINLIKNQLKIEGKENKLYYKRDGSLTNGFEIVSHPMTLMWIKKELKLNKILDILRNKGVSSYRKGTCGFHVHLSKNYFNGTEVDKLRLFINRNYIPLYNFSRRKGMGDNYIKKEEYNLKEFKNCICQSGRYWAYNLNTHKETVEIRIFRGTLSYKRIIASLELCDAMAHYIKHISFMNAGRSESWKEFLIWCKKENRYNKFLSLLTIDQ